MAKGYSEGPHSPLLLDILLGVSPNQKSFLVEDNADIAIVQASWCDIEGRKTGFSSLQKTIEQ